jgi:hypothetical protein
MVFLWSCCWCALWDNWRYCADRKLDFYLDPLDSNPRTGVDASGEQVNLHSSPNCVLQLPGVNVPSHHFVYYFLALFVSAILHEMGHAVAGARQRMLSVEFFLTDSAESVFG